MILLKPTHEGYGINEASIILNISQKRVPSLVVQVSTAAEPLTLARREVGASNCLSRKLEVIGYRLACRRNVSQNCTETEIRRE